MENDEDVNEDSARSDSSTSSEYVDIDEFLIRSGECGLYQIRFIILMKLLTFPSSFPVFIFYFIGIDPSWTKHSDSSVHPKTDSARCQLNRSEWSYNYSKTTIVTEYDLVCENTWLLGVIGSSVFLGWGVGSILTGYLSDIYGRKTVMIPCILGDLLCLFLHTFIKPIWLLIIVRFLMGVFHSGPALNAYIMLVEFIGPNCRVLAANIAGSVWVIGAAVLSLKAYLIDDWRILCAVSSAPYFVVLFTGCCFPESIRWLNTKDRTSEAEYILKKAAKTNKKDLTKLHIKPASAASSLSLSYLDLFSSWKVAKVVFSQAFMWFISGTVYYTFAWAFADLGGDIYVNFFLSIAVEVPMHVIAVICLQTLGRKKTSYCSFFLTSLSCLAVGFLSTKSEFASYRLLFGLCGKSGISLAFMSIYMWSAEIYPTVVRTQGMGINIITSRAGAAMSPFVKILDHIHPAAPFFVMAVPTFISFLLCFLLPETLKEPTRETFEQLTEQ